MPPSLVSKIAVITGAASGVGKSITRALLEAGATVIACDINDKLLHETQAELSSLGSIDVVVADLTRAETAELLVREAVEKHGRIDILINNAGIYDGLVPVEELDLELYNRLIALNLTAPTFLTKFAVQQYLREDGSGPRGGVILNMGSICSLRGGLAGTAYTIAKHGLLGLTRSTAAQYWKKGIRCNILLPGGMRTNILSGVSMNPTGSAMSYSVKGLLEPEQVDTDDLAKVVVFVCSDEAHALSGASISVDHGWQAL